MSSETSSSPWSWGHERVEVVQDRETGLRAVVAIHSTALGPSLGGLRICPYPGGLPEALDDVLRLSRAMTLKASAAGLDLGGGKAVVLDDGRDELRRARLGRFAAMLEALGGAYITAEDVGTTTADMDLIATHTAHVVGRSPHDGTGGDPSPDTARTVLGGIRAALRALDGSDELGGRTVGVLGLGKVGGELARMLLDAGVVVVGFDPVAPGPDGVELAASEEEVLSRALDVLSPCALGGVIDPDRADALRCRVVCGAANNPLADAALAERLAARGILYVPDFLANCGGLVHADGERRGTSAAEVERCLDAAGERLADALDEAQRSGRLPLAVAEEHALARVAAARRPAAAPA